MRTYDQIAADAREGSAFSNGSQFEYWAGGPKGCYSCRNDSMGGGPDEPEKFCPILGVAIGTGTTPVEWVTFSDEEAVHGNYTCTEFDERRDDGPEGDPEPTPPPVVEGQIDMFEVFAEKIADEASSVRTEGATQ